jgi:hypothetical protein
MPKTAIDIIEATTKVVRKGSVCGGSAPVLMVGCGVKTWMLKSTWLSIADFALFYVKAHSG